MDMSAMSVSDEPPELLSVCEMSSAKAAINAILCAKLAGLGALSALCVLNSRSNLYGFSSDVCDCFRAVVARLRCAFWGGLKDESRT
jgi:hypothetical protein